MIMQLGLWPLLKTNWDVVQVRVACYVNKVPVAAGELRGGGMIFVGSSVLESRMFRSVVY